MADEVKAELERAVERESMEKDEMLTRKDEQIAHLKVKWQEDLDVSKSKLNASEQNLKEVSEGYEVRMSSADQAGYFVGKLEGEAISKDYQEEKQMWLQEKQRLENEVAVGVEKAIELELIVESVKQTAMEEQITVDAEKRQLEEEVRIAEDETRIAEKRCEARVREALYFRDEAIQGLEIAQQRANDKVNGSNLRRIFPIVVSLDAWLLLRSSQAMKMADERIRCASLVIVSQSGDLRSSISHSSLHRCFHVDQGHEGITGHGNHKDG